MILQNIFGIIGKKNQMLSKKASKVLSDIPPDSFVKNNAAKTVKEIIKSVLPENTAIQRDLDFGRFEGIYGLIKRAPKIRLFKVIDKTKSTKWTTYFSDSVACHYNKDNKLEKFLIYNFKRKDISVFDKSGNIIKQYSPEESRALLGYKHDSKDIHKLLRYNKSCKDEENVRKYIDILSGIFNDENKVLKNKQKIIAYRALDGYSLKQISTMPGNGMIFTDPSFVSVTTKKRSLLQFLNHKNFNHIMKVEIPPNSGILDMDEIGNIVLMNFPENELLLKNGSNFLIKNKNGHKGMIEAVYLGN